MDVDDLLGRSSLPDVDVDVDGALAATRTRGASRRRRGRAGAGVAVAALVVAGVATAVAITGDDGTDGVTTGAPVTAAPVTPAPLPEPTATTTGAPTVTSAPGAGAGDPAVWAVDPVAPPSSDATTFGVLVTRLGCNGGVTGAVVGSSVQPGAAEVVVTFTVTRVEGDATCPGNDAVVAAVDLGGPLGDRTLVDGACLPGGAAETTSFCADGPVRWNPPAPGPTTTPALEPDASEAAIDVVARLLDHLRAGDLEAAAELWTGYPFVGPDPIGALGTFTGTHAWLLGDQGPVLEAVPGPWLGEAWTTVTAVVTLPDGSRRGAAFVVHTGDDPVRIDRIPETTGGALPDGTVVRVGEVVTLPVQPLEGGIRAFLDGTEVPVTVEPASGTASFVVPERVDGDVLLVAVAASPEVPAAAAVSLHVVPAA